MESKGAVVSITVNCNIVGIDELVSMVAQAITEADIEAARRYAESPEAVSRMMHARWPQPGSASKGADA